MLLGLMSLAIWAVTLITRLDSSPVLQFYPMRWALCGLIIACAISYAIAMSRPINGDEVSPADVAMLSLLSWAGTMLIASDGITTRSRIDDLVWRIVAAGGLLGLLGLAQFIFAQSFVDVIRIPGLIQLGSADLFYRNGLVRPNGTATHPIEYGAILAMILPLALHVAFQHLARPLWRWIPLLAIGAVIGISGSRSAYLCAVAGVVVCVFAWTPTLRRWAVGVSAAGLIAVALFWPRMMRTIVGLFDDPGNDPSITSRTDSFDLAWAFISENPLFGRGFGTFLPKYRIFDNQFLVQLVSAGIVGTLALLGLAIVSMLEMRRFARSAQGSSEALRSRALAGSLAGCVLAGFVRLALFDTFAFPMTMGTLFLVLGVIGALSRLERDDAPFLHD
jgi:O-antigen ligase